MSKRTISHVALNKIFSKDIWSDIFNNKYKTYESSVDALAPFFIKWGVQNANIIYSMNTDDYPFLVYAKKMGLKIIVDPCVSPLSHQILYDEYKMLKMNCSQLIRRISWDNYRHQLVSQVADIILCPSEWVAHGWKILFPEVSHKIRISPYGSSFQVRNLVTSSPDKIILFAGRDQVRKGFRYFAQAASIIQQKHPDWKFVVAGLNAAEVNRTCECKHLTFLGHVPLENMQSLYKRAYAFV
ncbi:MAG: glycosyltransferase, partial [Clostridia bacterium]|nr:glycosyltransferase [Clostridia bacterium]